MSSFLISMFMNCRLFIVLLTLSSCPAKEATAPPASGKDTLVGSPADRERLQATARLHEAIGQLPAVKHKVAPVTTLESGEVKVLVDVSLNVGSVLYLSDAQQMMTCSVFVAVEWRDLSLVWDPEDYGNVSVTETSPDSVWIPAVILINSPSPVNIMSSIATLFLHSSGRVKALVYFKAVTLCTMDHSQFPYDSQTCGFVLEAPSPCCRINLTFDVMKAEDAASLIVQSDWELVSMHREAALMPGLYSTQLKLRRRTVYFTVCLVLPMVLTSYMNVLVFLLPVGCGEKFSFLISLFVSTSLFISFFADVMPRSLDTVPSTMKLLVGVLAQSLLVLLATILVMYRHQAQETGAKVSPSVSSRDPGFTGSQREAAPGGKEGRRESQMQAEASSVVSVREDAKGPAAAAAAAAGGRNFQCQQLGYWDAQKMDRAFFLVGFVTNTIFMAALLVD